MEKDRRSDFLLACPLLVGFAVSAAYHIVFTGLAHFDIGVLFGAIFLGCIALPPYGFVSLALYLARRWPIARQLCLAGAGIIALAALGAWIHYEVSQSRSSTAAVALMFLPVYGTIIVGPALFGGWLVSLLPCFPREDREMRLARGACPECGYNLRGKLEEGCPECGYRRPG